MESVNERLSVENAEEVGMVTYGNIPDGKAGLEWQKVVKHCLMTSINRLQNL